jgi:hypothetical protein
MCPGCFAVIAVITGLGAPFGFLPVYAGVMAKNHKIALGAMEFRKEDGDQSSVRIFEERGCSTQVNKAKVSAEFV